MDASFMPKTHPIVVVEFALMGPLIIVGGGLAGCEAAWQAAKRGVSVNLYEMRPSLMTAAHRTFFLAELVCSNSLGSNLLDRPSGLLKEELRLFGSLLLETAESCRIPAGSALAVDRDSFSQEVTKRITNHPLINVIREEVRDIPPGLVIVTTGPLTSPALAESIRQLLGADHLYFYDAIAPIISTESINFEIAFKAGRARFGVEGGADYINCPLTQEEYHHLVTALCNAERIPLKEFEQELNQGVRAGFFFEGCLPVEILAQRGELSLAFGAMRPMGLIDPYTQKRPFAVVQLRQETQSGDQFNLVGFQTNLTHSEQKRVIRLVPGLENAEILRYGQMHRNSFINAPLNLIPTLQSRNYPNLLFAGQIAGIEGYIGNIATGMLAGINAARIKQGKNPLVPPPESMLGSLCRAISCSDPGNFQPVKANFGLIPGLSNPPKTKKDRAARVATRALDYMRSFRNSFD
jgi:methylenetetrahydrofolate--tRNA-(uracil-5-)-methyltransferase